MKRIKVALLLISPGKAGVESVIGNILKYLPNDKVEVFLISSTEIASYYLDLIKADHHLVLGNFFNKTSNKYLFWIQRYLKHKLKLDERKLNRWTKKSLAFLEKNDIKTMHANLVWDYWVASKIKELRPDIRYINTMHGTLALDPLDDYFPFFQRETILRILSNVDVFTSACQYFIDLLQLWKIPLRQTEIISNGIDKDLAAHRKETNSESIVKICFMGGGRPHQKGGDLLIYALRILNDELKVNNFKLIVYGEVPLNSKEKSLAVMLGLNEKIEWRGFVEPPLHLEGMKESDIFVLPSRHEGVANTLMEAIGMELPIIATKVGGTPEVIKDGVNGILCFVDARDLASCLALLIKDENIGNKFSLENKVRKSQFYWENICKEYEILYLG